MSSSWFTRRAALLGVLALGACGFTPVFGTNGASTKLRGAVIVETPQTVAGYRLGAALIEQLGAVETPRYMLRATLKETREQAAITISGAISRFDLTAQATWVLMEGEVEVASGQNQTFASYSATGSTLAEQTARRDARERLSQALADLIIADLILAAP